jgi:hypothetical protein
MTSPRLDAMRAMVAKNPNNPLARFGNGYGRLAEALVHLDRTDEACEALRRGIEVSRRFGHPGMANEFEARLEELEGE